MECIRRAGRGALRLEGVPLVSTVVIGQKRCPFASGADGAPLGNHAIKQSSRHPMAVGTRLRHPSPKMGTPGRWPFSLHLPNCYYMACLRQPSASRANASLLQRVYLSVSSASLACYAQDRRALTCLLPSVEFCCNLLQCSICYNSTLSNPPVSLRPDV